MSGRIFLNGRVTLYAGDCREVLATLPEASVDSVVCDPPYGLQFMGREWDKLWRNATNADQAYVEKTDGQLTSRARKLPDYSAAKPVQMQAFHEQWGREVFRVLKPGGHLVAFSGTRTYHRMACAIEDAGFEIRDQIGWAYGSGFPKSHDVSKAIDKAAGAERQILTVPRRWAGRDPNGTALGLMNDDAWEAKPDALLSVTAPATDAAKQWQGWGTALKPAWESVVLARKPLATNPIPVRGIVERELRARGVEGQIVWTARSASGAVRRGRSTNSSSIEAQPTAAQNCGERASPSDTESFAGIATGLTGSQEAVLISRNPDGTFEWPDGLPEFVPARSLTVAENVLQHGTGALNIDGCRVATDENPSGARRNGKPPEREAGTWANDRRSAASFVAERPGEALGRWPANLVHDGSPEVLAAFPETGGGTSFAQSGERAMRDNPVYGKPNITRNAPDCYGDGAGSAVRFFYTAKADADDRLGSKHPTVKPLDLMQWLVRLVTPKGGTVLDPFAGTGTTGEAAWREGMRAILIEREEEYLADIARRLELAANPTKRAAVAKTKNNLERPEDLPLFSSEVAE